MKLDISSFEKAVQSLEEALVAYDKTKLLDDSTEKEVMRDGIIQRFEYTYELSHKMLKRFLEMTASTPTGIGEMSFQEMIRTGSETGLLKNGWDIWKNYRQARTDTSHTYDADKAEEVLAIVPAFLQEAKFLLAELEKRKSETD
jgi:nucleotidyltransferase substrate binding protein (TIGR01987 family)